MTVLFFDLDGTLTNPKQGIVNCITHALQSMGIEEVPRDLDWCIGPPLQDSFVQMVGQDRAGEAIRLYRQRFAAEGLYENAVYEGIEALLSDLKARDVSLYVATSKARVYAVRILEHFGLAHYFTDIFGAELNGLYANKVDLLAHALCLTDVQADQAIMLGDRKHDILGAKANDMASIGHLWGFGSFFELEQAGADCIARDVNELSSHLKQLLA